MAITDYASLQSEVLDWLEDTTLSSKVPTFIQLAEADLTRRLNADRMEADVSLTLASGAVTTALPSTFLSVEAVAIEINNSLVPLLADDQFEVKLGPDITGIPSRYAIDGSNIIFDVLANQAYTIYVRYNSTLALSNTSTTNWLLTAHPDLYLAATLAQAYAYRSAFDKAATWKAQTDALVQDVDTAILFSRKQITARLDTPSDLSYFDINRG